MQIPNLQDMVAAAASRRKQEAHAVREAIEAAGLGADTKPYWVWCQDEDGLSSLLFKAGYVLAAEASQRADGQWLVAENFGSATLPRTMQSTARQVAMAYVARNSTPVAHPRASALTAYLVPSDQAPAVIGVLAQYVHLENDSRP
jgi:hypothetical protein